MCIIFAELQVHLKTFLFSLFGSSIHFAVQIGPVRKHQTFADDAQSSCDPFLTILTCFCNPQFAFPLNKHHFEKDRMLLVRRDLPVILLFWCRSVDGELSENESDDASVTGKTSDR